MCLIVELLGSVKKKIVYTIQITTCSTLFQCGGYFPSFVPLPPKTLSEVSPIKYLSLQSNENEGMQLHGCCNFCPIFLSQDNFQQDKNSCDKTLVSTIVPSSPHLIASMLYTSLIEKALITRIKKPVLNPTLTLTLTLVLCAKHDVFHCLYEGKFLVSLRQSRVGPASYNQCQAFQNLDFFNEIFLQIFPNGRVGNKKLDLFSLTCNLGCKVGRWSCFKPWVQQGQIAICLGKNQAQNFDQFSPISIKMGMNVQKAA